MKAEVTLSSPVELTPRVRQMAGLFDVPLEDKWTNSWSHELPIEDQAWHVGLIVGPSGSGKTSLAKYLWPDRVIDRFEWPHEQSLLDAFPAQMPIKSVVNLLTSVGLGSPPVWIRPYRTMSTGEAFRATIARALAEADGLVAIDEFTSVVDRQVAQVASHTVQKAVRKAGRQLVAVTCHYDVESWLQPDWTYDVAAQEFTWRSVQRHPEIDLEVHRCDRSLWRLFAPHHYLSSQLGNGAQCFAGYVRGRPVVFQATINFPHPRTRNIRMNHRVVVLPDWQGLGICGKLLDWLGQYLWDQGLRFHSVVAHPAMIAYHVHSPRWRESKNRPRVLHGSTSDAGLNSRMQTSSRSLGVRSFEYVAPASPA